MKKITIFSIILLNIYCQEQIFKRKASSQLETMGYKILKKEEIYTLIPREENNFEHDLPESSQSSLYKCLICCNYFFNKLSLSNHIFENHQDNPIGDEYYRETINQMPNLINCPFYCNFKTHQHKYLLRHVWEEHKRCATFSTIYNALCGNKAEINQPKTIKTHRKKTSCGICYKEYCDKQNLKNHIFNTHYNHPQFNYYFHQSGGKQEEIKRCDKCQYCSLSLYLIENHKKTQHAMFSCNICNFKTPSIFDHSEHIANHQLEKISIQ